MAETVTIGAVDLRPGELRSVEAAGKRIGLAHVDGRLFAFDDECTHEQCPLVEEGVLEGHVVTCGCHGAQFDVRTGAVVSPPAPRPIATYPVSIRGNQLTLEL